MSYDIVITCAPIPHDDAEAQREIDAICDRHGPVVPRMDAFYGDLVALYPSGDTLCEEDWEENCPWSDGSLRDAFDADWAHVALRQSAAERVVPAIVDVAHRHGLAVLDCSIMQIHRGDGHRGFRLDVEGRHILIAPREDQIRGAAMALSPDGDGAFLILTASDGDYAQAAGGLGEYVFERRDYGGGAFRHWTAGHGEPAAETHRVRTRLGAHVEVRISEVLSAEDACRLLLEFAWGRGLSPDYAWRDITAEFPQAWNDQPRADRLRPQPAPAAPPAGA